MTIRVSESLESPASRKLCLASRGSGLDHQNRRWKNGKISKIVLSAAAGLSLLRPNQSTMTNILLSGDSTNKTKEAGNFAFLITDVIILDGMGRVDVVGYLADAGIYCHEEDDVVYGMDESDLRNERMVLKAVGHLGDSEHKYNPMALSQLAAAWPASRTVPIELDKIGAYSYNEGGQLMANASVLPFGGAQSLEVAYGAGINLISNMYTAGRMGAFTRNLLFPTVTAIVNGLAASERSSVRRGHRIVASSIPASQRRARGSPPAGARSTGNSSGALSTSW